MTGIRDSRAYFRKALFSRHFWSGPCYLHFRSFECPGWFFLLRKNCKPSETPDFFLKPTHSSNILDGAIPFHSIITTKDERSGDKNRREERNELQRLLFLWLSEARSGPCGAPPNPRSVIYLDARECNEAEKDKGEEMEDHRRLVL